MSSPRHTIVFAIVIAAGVPTYAQPGKQIFDYYPAIEPFRTGYLKVDDLHEIYYELSGNPLGHPVMVLHGGPGGGSYPSLRRYHHPEKYQIIVFDQRGAGKSKPYAEVKENNTAALVSDMEKLRAELKVEKMQLFGGSWGSTLALAYAQKHPDRVDSMVLRGVFLARRQDIDYFYHGGTGQYFPEVFATLKSHLPNPDKPNYPRQLLDLLQREDESLRKKVARAWAAYETKCAALETPDSEVNSLLDGSDCYNFSLLENWYMAHDCFLQEGELLKNAGKLKDIPTVIVHGRYDVICPPSQAYELHKALPGSELVLVESAGHSGSAILMRSALINAIITLEPRILGEKK